MAAANMPNHHVAVGAAVPDYNGAASMAVVRSKVPMVMVIARTLLDHYALRHGGPGDSDTGQCDNIRDQFFHSRSSDTPATQAADELSACPHVPNIAAVARARLSLLRKPEINEPILGRQLRGIERQPRGAGSLRRLTGGTGPAHSNCLVKTDFDGRCFYARIRTAPRPHGRNPACAPRNPRPACFGRDGTGPSGAVR
ncbi:hypothetical protein ABIB68_006820 [Bradyrhizobium sp. F1.2.2]